MNTAGRGVDIYILDSGVNIKHKWFSGRASHFHGLDGSRYTNGESNVSRNVPGKELKR